MRGSCSSPSLIQRITMELMLGWPSTLSQRKQDHRDQRSKETSKFLFLWVSWLLCLGLLIFALIVVRTVMKSIFRG